MSLTALTELRDFVQSIDDISVYLTERFGRAPKHTIGYKKPSNQNDYPFFAYVPVFGVVGGMGGDQQAVSLIIGVCEQGITDDIYDGVSTLAYIQSYLMPQLLAGPIGDHTTLSGPIRVIDDLGAGHPFYQKELQLPVVVHPVYEAL